MTPAEWERENRRLKGALTRATTKRKKCTGTLAERLDLVKLETEANGRLQLHKLNYFELIK